MVEVQSYLCFAPIDYGIPSDDFYRLLVMFVDQFSQFVIIETKREKRGRKAYEF